MLDITHEYYDSVDSTNDRIKSRAHENAKEGLVITAMNQTKGKGRVGRKWESPVGESVATSMLLHPTGIPMESVPTITIVCGMAVRDALEQLYGLDAKIKWPNDIVVNGKKICGILVEMEAEAGKVKHVIAGIGVNVHQKTFPEEIAFKATSVDIELKRNSSDTVSHRNQVAEAIWEAFNSYYDRFLTTADMTNLKSEYEAHLVNLGKRVRIEDPRGAYEATACGINERGALIIDVDGKKEIIESGEVSVRGLYGYV